MDYSKEVERLLAEKGGIQLDIGCGRNKQANFVGMDKRPFPNVDIVHDVLDFPWPLPDECVITAVASHLVEHICPLRFVDFMDEVWRVMKYGHQFAVIVPHGRSEGFLQDPTHCAGFTEMTWAYFDPVFVIGNTAFGDQLYRFYEPKPWKMVGITSFPWANMEVVLEKRREDWSYHAEQAKQEEESERD